MYASIQTHACIHTSRYMDTHELTDTHVYRYLARYCPSLDKYSKLCDLPLKEWYGFAVATLGKSIYAIGGVSKGKWQGYVYRCVAAARTTSLA